MATVTVNVAEKFPEGTSVSAYTRGSQAITQNGPSGTAVATATVTEGSVTFSGLTEDERYVAYGYVGSTWVKQGFTVNEEIDPVFFRGVEIATKAQLDAIELESETDLSGVEADITALEADVAVIGETLNLLTNSATDQAATLQTACDNIESQGGGKVLLPATDYSGLGITLSSRVDVGMAVDLQGHGKRGTKFRLNNSAAGLYFVGSSDAGYSGSTNRGGESGGFHIDGNNTATNPLIIRSTNRAFKDIRVSTPANNGEAILLDGCQNCNFFNIEAEDGSHSSSRTVIGILLDGAACGNNFFGTSLNEFTNGHIVFDASYDAPSALGIDYSNNNVFVGNMIERTDTYAPVIYAKAGANNHFIGGNITSGGTSDSSLASEYSIVKLDNTAARSFSNIGSGGAPTREFTFHNISFTGTLGSGSSTYSNVFLLESDLTSWHKHVYVGDGCSYANNKYLARLNAGSCVLIARHQDNGSGGGLSSGWSNPSGAGKINSRIQSSANTITAKAGVDYYELSGNTTLNTLSATHAGHQVVIKFGGAPTVSSSAGNIKLSGLVDMSATADDILCLICDGTNWHETSRVVK